MVEIERYGSMNLVQELNLRAPSCLMRYIQNNLPKHRLYFFYGNDAKQYKLGDPAVYVIYKNSYDRTQNRLLIDILQCLAPLIMNNVCIILYTKEMIDDISPLITILPSYVLSRK